MNFEQLQSFRSVAELGSFSRAGDARFLAQSTVSMQIAALERELGVRLFERLGWRVILTDAGERFLRYTNRILALADDARKAMVEIHGLVAGELVVGASHTVGNYLVPELFGRFNARHPGVRLVLEISRTPRVAERVFEGSLDVGLVEAPVSSPELLVRPFTKDELVLIVQHEHPWALKGEIEPGELTNERFIAREPESITRRIVEERFRSLGVEIRPVLELGSPEAIRGAVRAGLGVAIVSRHAMGLALAAGVIAEVRIKGLQMERDLNVVLHSDKYISPALSAFLSLMGLDPNDLQDPNAGSSDGGD